MNGPMPWRPGQEDGLLGELRAVLDALAIGVIVADAQGSILIANRAARDIPHQGQDWDIRSLEGRVLAEHEWPLARLLRGESIAKLDVQLVHKHSGVVRVVRNAGRVLVTPSGGELAVMTMVDVTEDPAAEDARTQLRQPKQRQNQELRQACQRAEVAAAEAWRKAAKLDAVLAAIAEAVVVCGPDGAVILANQPAVQYFDLRRRGDEAPSLKELQRRLELSTNEQQRSEAVGQSPVARALRGESVVGELLCVRGLEARPRWLKISATPIRDPAGELLRIVLIATDVTVIKELDQRRSAMLKMVSHDLRSPLNSVMLQAQLLRERLRADSGEQQMAETLLAGADRLVGIIRALTEQVRLLAGTNLTGEPSIRRC